MKRWIEGEGGEGAERGQRGSAVAASGHHEQAGASPGSGTAFPGRGSSIRRIPGRKDRRTRECRRGAPLRTDPRKAARERW